ncbi:hypothetical protein EV363DRAFT_854068 [Boletus edulis]|uniref:Uncharacterized protein n=1 Tax=Boletus edulis BED1 TaxID=1328754 RepID=A0AAD4BWY4_BOLED|nr:hypothetical protein EV363DRAFT_854068 [Boletus edulis]KAF8442261.1 hypothetical protein L210DRAFT_3203023 [Boletus edulis BED1]
MDIPYLSEFNQSHHHPSRMGNIIFSIYPVATGSDPRFISAATTPTLEISTCRLETTPLTVSLEVATILQIVHGAAMCILAVFQFMRQSLQMYGVTKRWQLNRYMNLLVQQGILSFFAYVLVPIPFRILYCHSSRHQTDYQPN